MSYAHHLQGADADPRYGTLVVSRQRRVWRIRLNRPERRNSISREMVRDLMDALDGAERDPHCLVVVLEGQDGVFCTGMDLEEAARGDDALYAETDRGPNAEFMALLRRLASVGRIVVAKVEGVAMAGGVGLVAASDLVIATPDSQLSLPEAMWGLLPACVAPFLIRRVGPQQAFRMTLTTEPVGAPEALRIGLVDRVSPDPNEALQQYLLRLERLRPETVGNIKSYFGDLWILDRETERRAVLEGNRLATDPRVRKNIRDFVELQKFPWEEG